MKKLTPVDGIFIGMGVVALAIILYVVSHPTKSICDTSPNSGACADETRANDDAYQQYLQNGNH